MKPMILAAALAVTMATGAVAQQPMPMPNKDMPMSDKAMPGKDMGPGMTIGMDMRMMPDAKDTPSTAAYKAMMMKQMKSMPAFSGNGDTDYMTHMRHHHQAAVEMSKLVIAGTKNAEITKLAQEIITAQEKEITVIDAWLKKKPS